MALLGPREMSDLSPQDGAKRTLLRPHNFMSTRRRRAHIRAACAGGEARPAAVTAVPSGFPDPGRDSRRGCQGATGSPSQAYPCPTPPWGRRRTVAGRGSRREGSGRGLLDAMKSRPWETVAELARWPCARVFPSLSLRWRWGLRYLPTTRLNTMAAMPASTALPIGDDRMLVIDPNACC